MVSYIMSGFRDEAIFGGVLILIVMDNGLLQASPWPLKGPRPVLILIVMDNGLLPIMPKVTVKFI